MLTILGTRHTKCLDWRGEHEFRISPNSTSAIPPLTARGRLRAPWLTPEGIAVKPAYGPDDLAGLDFLDTFPGIAPFLRGPYPTMYVTQPWTIRQYAGFSTAEDSNAFYRRNLAAGQKGLSVAFDLATHRGYDSDHPRVAGDVGMAGVAIDSVEDMRTLFDRHPARSDVGVDDHERRGAARARVLRRRRRGAGVQPEQLTGTIQNDILKEFMVRNTYIYPPEPSLRIVSDIFAYTAAHMPKFNSISISGYHMQEAGATLRPRARLYARRRRRICARRARRRARHRPLRAAAVVLLERRHEFLHGGGEAARRAHAVGQAPQAVRAEVGALARAARPHPDLGLVARRRGRVQQRGAHRHRGDGGDAGGTQSLHTNALDEALALPTDFSARIARNTQIVLQRESGTTRIIDPWGGSFYVERLTYDLAKAAWRHICEVEDNYSSRSSKTLGTRKEAE